MASTRGRCSNLDFCAQAGSRRDIEVPLGQDFVCPECGKPLIAPPIKASNAGRVIALALVGGGMLALVGSGVLLGSRLSGQGSAPGGASAPAPAPEPSAGAPAAAPSTAVTPPAPPPPVPVPAPVPQPEAAPAPAAVSPASPVASQDILFHIAGSDIIGASLAPELAGGYLTQTGDTDVRTLAGPQAGETLVVAMHNGRPEAIAIDSSSTAEGFARLGAGGAEVAMAARQVTPAEHDALSGLGDMNTPAAEHVAAVDALVVVANANNPLRALSKQQLRGLLDGSITDWKQVGGTPGPVAVYARGAGEFGSEVTSLAGGGKPLAASVHQLPDDAKIAAAVSGDPQGVGIISLPPIMLHSHYAVQVRPLAISDTGSPALAPSNRPAVATLDYPYAFRLYLYVHQTAPAPAVKRFIDFVDSRDGEAVADAQGFVSQSVAPQELVLPDSVSNRFRQYVEGAKLLAVHFRFKTNSSELDVAGQRDLDRVTNYLISNRYTGDNLILAGFADSQGGAALNNTLSQKRAEALASLLTQRGLKPAHVAGFGAELPLADNNTQDGRERNRRVEMYLLP